jgi:hypothetical protein
MMRFPVTLSPALGGWLGVDGTQKFSRCLGKQGAQEKLLSSLDIVFGKGEFGKGDLLMIDGDFLLTSKE